MRPVDFQPAVVQAPSAERTQQQQQSQPQISQQAFAGEMQKLAEDRAHQVRETGQGHESRPPEEMTEDKREKPRQRARHRRAPAASAPGTPEKEAKDSNPADGPHIDVRV